MRIRWHKRRWICREHTFQIATLIGQNHSVRAPRARLGTRAICWVIRQLCIVGATITGLAEHGEGFRSGIQIATLDPFQGQQNAIAWPAPRVRSVPEMPFISSSTPVVRSRRYAGASSKTRGVTLATEYYYRRTFITRDQVYTGVATWIEHFCN